MGFSKFKTTPRPASIGSSHPSLRTNVPANQFVVDSQRQSEGPTLREREEENRLKRHIRRLDDTTRHALLESLQSEFLSLDHQEEVSASFASLADSFEAEISKQEGWYEELGYVPGEHLEFRSKRYHWKEEPNTQCMTVQITGEPTENNVDIQSQQPEGGISNRKSIWLKGTATLDKVTGKWTAVAEMEVHTPEELGNLTQPGWRAG